MPFILPFEVGLAHFWAALYHPVVSKSSCIDSQKAHFLEPYRRVCPGLPVDASLVTENLDQAHAAALAGHNQEAALAYTQATQWALESDADTSNNLCWQGSLDNFAKIVLPACDYAIKLDPNDVNFHDSRGLARALVGDTQGAIADFKFVSDPSHGYGNLSPDEVKERQSWLQALEAGRSPFDAKTLKALQGTFP